MRNTTYKVGTHVNLKKKDDRLTKLSTFIYRTILPLVAIVFIADYALRVNGL